MTDTALSPRKQRLVEAFRAALRESTGYSDADEISRVSLHASIGADPDLLSVWREETAPAQAALDLHLAGESVEDHATNARQFSDFVAGVSSAVKATVKDRLGLRAYTEDLLIDALAPGSLRVVLRARDPITTDPTITEPGSTVDSDALRGIASVLIHAGDDTPDSPLTAELGKGPPGSAPRCPQRRPSGVGHRRGDHPTRLRLRRPRDDRTGRPNPGTPTRPSTPAKNIRHHPRTDHRHQRHRRCRLVHSRRRPPRIPRNHRRRTTPPPGRRIPNRPPPRPRGLRRLRILPTRRHHHHPYLPHPHQPPTRARPRTNHARHHHVANPSKSSATRAFQACGKTSTDPRRCAPLLDRLTFGGTIIETGTDSYRLDHTHN
jgi:hypothetical protein